METFEKMKQIIDETPDGPIKDEMRQGYVNLRCMDVMFKAIDKAFAPQKQEKQSCKI